MNFDHILVTTDFSEDSLRAFDLAAYEAKMQKSKLTLLAVVADWDVPPAFMYDIANPESISKYREELREKAEEKLAEYSGSRFHEQKVNCVAVLSSDPVSKVICDYAKENSVNLIVMSSHGRGAVGSLLVGSTVQKVIRTSTCPVMVVPRADS
jgi:nucleotide-binding universal stress UspA family protein